MALLRLALLALAAAPSALAATTASATTYVTAIPLEQEFTEPSTTTVDAVALEGKGESSTTVDERSLDEDSTSGTKSPSTTGNLGDETPEEDTAGATTSSAPSEEATAASEPPPASSSGSGLINWMPYRRGSPYRNTMDREPVAVLEPVAGRWVSKDVAEVKLINTVPAFILPQVKVWTKHQTGF